MRKIHEVLRLKWQAGLSHAKIARAVGLSKGAVAKYVSLAAAQGIGWPTGLSETELSRRGCFRARCRCRAGLSRDAHRAYSLVATAPIHCAATCDITQRIASVSRVIGWRQVSRHLMRIRHAAETLVV